MATDVTHYTQTVVAKPTTPTDATTGVFDYNLNFPLYREIVKRDLVDEPQLKMELSSAQSYFTGESMIDASTLLANLPFGQEIIVNVLKDQNPFSLFKKDALTYTTEGMNDLCHTHIKLDCTMSCLNTLPEFDQLRFRFDCKYTYGVRMCAKNKDFWTTEFFTQQYALSKRACQFGREVDLWNEVIDGLKTAPATTVDAAIAKQHATHYWAGLGTVTANARCTIPTALYYLTHSFVSINPTIFITSEFATELIRSVEAFQGQGANLSNVRVNTYEQWNLPGYQLANQVQTILGVNVPVVILERSPWMTYNGGDALSTQYPLWNEDGTKQYVAILDPRVGYSFEKEGFHLDIKPYDCDKLYAGMVDEIYVGHGITFPQFGMLLEFGAFTYC